MHVLIVYSHPEPASFNGALKDTALETLRKNGHTAEVSDLYGDHFDPRESAEHYVHRSNTDWFSPTEEQRHASNESSLPQDVGREIAKLERADLVIFQFPLWWHAQPAILKGYFDRVFVAGKLYTSRMRYDRGYFRGKRALCSVTTGAPEATFHGNGRGGNMDTIMWPIHYSLYYMGFTVLPAFVAHGIQSAVGFDRLTGNIFEQHLKDMKHAWTNTLETLGERKSLIFPGWDDWDERGCSPVSL